MTVPLMAIKPWINWDYEGVVKPGQYFEATESRSRELISAGLATPQVSSAEVISVTPDPPTRFDARDDAPQPAVSRSSSRRRGASETASTSVR